ncbi:MAG: hypothetical protein OEY89_15385 [Gammaproteobacteria bacterium]|nr:hypothetical protein [Gammaproteobacteria bacterium]
MFEYIFFLEENRDVFTEHLKQKNIEPCLSTTHDGMLVSIDEDIDDDLLDEIDEIYDGLLARCEQKIAEEEGGQYLSAAGITINLKDGRAIEAAVNPDILNRILTKLSISELDEFIQTIVDAVEQPDERPFCQQAMENK